jgi:Domain of unknown function (DUF4136)
MRRVLTGVVPVLAACTAVPPIQTVISPDGGTGGLPTFTILPAPGHIGAMEGANDPMIANSSAHTALRSALLQGFASRGYTLADSSPDFAVAYYAARKDKLDIMRWDYGYPWWPRWWRGWGARGPVGPMEATEYAPGTVVVDVIDAKTSELLWRGKGRAPLADDERAYELRLRETVTAILAGFPCARLSIAHE